MTMDKDFNVEIRVRNGRLLSAVKRKFGSSAEMCRQTNIREASLYALISMKHRPVKQNGEPTEVALNIAAALGMDFEDLWPKHMERLKRKKASFEIEMSSEEVQRISDMPMERLIDYKSAIAVMQERLTPRERDVIQWRFTDNLTYAEIGEIIGTWPERARQIEAQAFRKMRWWGARKKIREEFLLDQD